MKINIPVQTPDRLVDCYLKAAAGSLNEAEGYDVAERVFRLEIRSYQATRRTPAEELSSLAELI